MTTKNLDERIEQKQMRQKSLSLAKTFATRLTALLAPKSLPILQQGTGAGVGKPVPVYRETGCFCRGGSRGSKKWVEVFFSFFFQK